MDKQTGSNKRKDNKYIYISDRRGKRIFEYIKVTGNGVRERGCGDDEEKKTRFSGRKYTSDKVESHILFVKNRTVERKL